MTFREPDARGASPLAVAVGTPSARQAIERPVLVDRVVVHQTGATIVKTALDAKIDPVEKCIAYYTSKGQSSHYLIGWDGTIYLLSDERLRIGHVGISSRERALYRRGWDEGKADQDGRTVSRAALKHWREVWRAPTPNALYPGKSINDCSIGIEMPPTVVRSGRGWVAVADQWLGSHHSQAQYRALAALIVDISKRWHWPPGWRHGSFGETRSRYVLGHEDVDLYGRTNAGGGWDPGALRATPWFLWPWLWHWIGHAIYVGDPRMGDGGFYGHTYTPPDDPTDPTL